ncbi:TetR/AcrR family transcriptional regulator [Williamsia sp. SKLECPSW1]
MRTPADDPPDTAVSTTRAEQKAATRERLLSAASELFAEREFGEVTVADIAGRAGVAHGLLFHHFGSKQAIYRAVLDGVVEEMDAAFVPDDDDPPFVAIRKGLRAHLGYIAEHPALATRLIAGGASTDVDVRGASQVGRDRVLRLLTDQLGVDADGDVVAFVASTVVAAVDEASVQWVRRGCSTPVDDLVEWLLAIGLAAIGGATTLDPDADVRSVLAALGEGEWSAGLDDA